ncbi:MAG: methylmalonyl Co-A mutase-associated GTPase MeaB [Acidimicrobiales bacterium]
MADVDVDRLAAGVREGDHTALGRAVTLVESSLTDHRVDAERLLRELLPDAGGAHRVGITGVPGVGKSTFIDALGARLVGSGHRVAVLAVDPTSSRTGGSILGDKTRMPTLAADPDVFVRPSPSAGTLGGVTRSTREAIVVLEAAGFDVVLVETMGVGQSETVVRGMVDFLVVLMLAGAGDELQGIKRGVLELADMLAVNKADGDNATRARLAAAEYRRALELTEPASPRWRPPVVTCSAIDGTGLDELWPRVEEHRRLLTASGELEQRRRCQRLAWMETLLEERLLQRLEGHPEVVARRRELEDEVRRGTLPPSAAVSELLSVLAG